MTVASPLVQEALVDLILQFRECDADFVRDLGIGESGPAL